MNYFYKKEDILANNFDKVFFFLKVAFCVLCCWLFFNSHEIYAAELDIPTKPTVSADVALKTIQDTGRAFKYCYIVKYSMKNPDGSITEELNYFMSGQRMYYLKNENGEYLCTGFDEYGSLTGNYTGYAFFTDGTYKERRTGTFVRIDDVWSPLGLCYDKYELLGSTDDILFFNNRDNVFFPRTPVPLGVTELEKTQQKIQQQVLPIIKPKLTKSLDFLVPLGIGLMACLIGVVILPKVLRKFLN